MVLFDGHINRQRLTISPSAASELNNTLGQVVQYLEESFQ
jgi:hypothetical protein